MNRAKKLFIITSIFLMLVGLTAISATDTYTNDTTTITQTSQVNAINDDTASTNVEPTSQADNIQEITNSQENINDKIGEKKQNLMASRTVTATTYTELNSYLTSNAYDTVTINIDNDIQLTGSTTLSTSIKTLTINGNDKSIDGSNKYRFLYINHQSNIIINNLTITQCNTTGQGGAIYNNRGNISIYNSTIVNNYAKSFGGAIYNNYGILTIHDSTLKYNLINVTVTYAGGGAIYNNYGNLTIFHSTLSNNTATPTDAHTGGGAIFNYYGKLFIRDSTLNNNYDGHSGAAVFNRYGNLTIYNSTLNNNIGRITGGAVYNYRGSMIFRDNILNNNTAQIGGAVDNYGNFTIHDCILNNNNARSAGGIFNEGNLTAYNITINNHSVINGGAITNYETMTIYNSTFNNNTASGYGGAVVNSDGKVIIYNSTLNNNKAGNGGAIYNNANTTIILKDSNITNNYVTSNNSYVFYSRNESSIIITNILFINNTDNVRDMLLGDVVANIDIHDNIYIDNFLESTIGKPNINIVKDNEDRSYNYPIDIKLRSIYNDTVHNGTLNLYINGVLINTSEVVNGSSGITFENRNLTKRENNITLEYISQIKDYQNSTTSFILYKEINTTLSIQAPDKMTPGEVAVINFTLMDVNNNPLANETIHVLVNEEQVDNVTTDSNGFANYTYTASGDGLVRIEATHHTSSDSFYLSAGDVVAWIDVSKIEPEIIIVPGNIIPQVETNITIYLFDDEGNPIGNKTLTVNITEDGKPDITGTVTTDENGIGVFNFTPTDEGTLNVNVTSPSDDIYHYASESVQVSLNFITTNLIVNASSTIINKTNTINVEVLVNVEAEISGTVELDIDGEIHTININNGRGTYSEYKSETAGEKLVTAKFTSDIPGYAGATTTEEFNVGKLPARVTIEAVNRTAGNVTLKVLVFPEDDIDSIVDGGNIVIESVDGENSKVIYNDTLVNGELIYLTDINETGWYEFVTIYHGNDYFYGEENNTESLEVLKVNTSTVTFNKTALVGDEITLNATVTDVDGNPVNDEKVTFLLDGTQLYHADGTPVEAILENGIATTEYTLQTIYTAGKYTITANYIGNNKYNMSYGESELSIELQETGMNITVLNDTKSNTTIEVILNTTDDKPIPEAEIIIIDQDGNVIGEGFTDENGTAIIQIDIPIGDNNITIIYSGDDINGPQEETITVTVTPRESQTTGTITNNTVGNVTIDVQVIDPVTDEPVTGPVKIIVDDEIVATAELDAEGKATIPVEIDKKGNYTIVIEYEGNDDYNGSTYTLDDVNIAGKDVDVDIVVDNQTIGNTTVNVTITDPITGEPIPNATVIITLPDGTNVTETTDENGTAIITIDVPPGDNNITIIYPGSDDYENYEETINIKVKSYSVVTVDPVEGVVLDNVTFTARVVDYESNPVTGGYVIFKVGSETLTDENGNPIRTCVDNGLAQLSYQAQSGWLVDLHPNLSVQAVYSGKSDVSSNNSDTSKVTIYKRNATVTVSAPDDYVNGTLHIDAVVSDQNGSLIDEGYIVFKLNGLTLKDEDNAAIITQVTKGTVHVDVKLPFAYGAKKYNLTAVFSDKIYNKVIGENTTTLKPISTYVNATVTIEDEFSKPVVTGQIYNQFNNAILEGTGIINIKFDGISYAKKVKVENGTFNVTLEDVSIYKPGTHIVEITAGANSHYEAVRQTITTVETPKYDVTTEFINITRNKTSTRVQAKIVDDKNKNVQKDLKITIKLNSKSFLSNQIVTNGNVDVLIDTSTLSNKNYTLELVSGANTYYNAGNAKTDLPKY